MTRCRIRISFAGLNNYTIEKRGDDIEKDFDELTQWAAHVALEMGAFAPKIHDIEGTLKYGGWDTFYGCDNCQTMTSWMEMKDASEIVGTKVDWCETCAQDFVDEMAERNTMECGDCGGCIHCIGVSKFAEL